MTGPVLVALVTLDVLIALGVIALWVRLGRRVASERSISEEARRAFADMQQALRDEADRTRQEFAGQSRAAREEMAGIMKAMREVLDQQLSAAAQSNQKAHSDLRTLLADDAARLRGEIASQASQAAEASQAALRAQGTVQQERLEKFQAQVRDLTEQFGSRSDALRDSIQSQFNLLNVTIETRLETVRAAVEERLNAIQRDSSEKLELMRQTVDEKLQSTLETRLGETFKVVGSQLEEVQRGLGEMRALASGVGDLKRVLSNVRSRGTWGEVQLGAMLEQVLTPEQYATNIATKSTAERVEFAIRLPGKTGDPAEVVWLPIDAKFPLEDYQRLAEAQEVGDVPGVESASKQLETRIKGCARDISEKYLSPPKTTDFGIMFLPTEGLFAEVVRRAGLAESLQRDYRVMIAGPTTLWAILSSLQMGFRTLAIEKRSSEVWAVLSAVKTEWGKFGDALQQVHKKLGEATNKIDALQIRSRAVGRKLRAVQEAPSDVAQLAPAPAQVEGLVPVPPEPDGSSPAQVDSEAIAPIEDEA